MASSREQGLLAQAVAGDRAAAEELVEHTYRKVYAALFRMCRDEELAADLTQETYRRAWASLKSFRGKSSLFTWLYRIGYTTFLNHVRRPRPLDLVGESSILSRDEMIDEGPSPEEATNLVWESERLRRAVMTLPDSLRFTVTARYWAEASVREIALQEGVTPVAVRKRLKKALRLLALALEEDAS